MDQIDRDTIECLRTWLSNRKQSTDEIDHYQSNMVIHPPSQMRSLGFPDLHLDKFTGSPIKTTSPNDFNQLFKWTMELLRLARANKSCLEAIELMRFNYNKRIAQFHVQEAINFIQGALCYDVSFDATVNLANHVTIEDPQTPIHEIMGKLCVCLFAKSPVKIIAKYNNYYTCLLSAFLVDMLHEAGVPAGLIKLFVYDPRKESAASFEGNSSSNCGPASLSRVAKLSMVSICFHDSDTNLACKCTLESYMREVYYTNMILLVEESIYEKFLLDWNSNYEIIVNKDKETTNWNVEADLNCIDLKSANRKLGHCISIVKFRSIGELCNLLSKLKKIPYAQLWTNRYLLAQELCMNRNYLGQCLEFWVNHLPMNILGRKFDVYLLKYFKDSQKEKTNEIYADIFHYHEDDILEVKKLQVAFMSHKVNNQSKRIARVLRVYLNLISKSKSTRQMNMSIGESVAKMKRFQLAVLDNPISEIPGESRVQSLLEPVGLAILVVRNEIGINCTKIKHVLVEFIFKNLLLGNGVILVCPPTTLGLRFPIELMKKIHLPFRAIDSTKFNCSIQINELLNESLNESATQQQQQQQQHQQQLESSIDSGLNTSLIQQRTRKQMKCPKNVYALELREAELTSDKVDALILALGTKRRTIWYPDGALHCNQQVSESV